MKTEFSFEDLLFREHLQISESRKGRGDQQSADLVGLALSSGGVRSATFHIGVIQGLARTGLLRTIDYVSGVEGGACAAGWLAARMKKQGFEEAVRSLDAEPVHPPHPPRTAWIWARNVGMHIAAVPLLLLGLLMLAIPASELKVGGVSSFGVFAGVVALGSLALSARLVWYVHRGKSSLHSRLVEDVTNDYLGTDLPLSELGMAGPYPLFQTTWGTEPGLASPHFFGRASGSETVK